MGDNGLLSTTLSTHFKNYRHNGLLLVLLKNEGKNKKIKFKFLVYKSNLWLSKYTLIHSILFKW